LKLKDISKHLKSHLCLLNEKVQIYQNRIKEKFLDLKNKIHILEIQNSQFSFQSNENAILMKLFRLMIKIKKKK
jgi:hypothetical protein